jgi:hypothetical protein
MKPKKSGFLAIDNVVEYVKFIDDTKQANERKGNNSELLFRGQPIDKPLLPKLARLNLSACCIMVCC